MSENPEIDVAYVAKLARLHLSDEETQLFQTQLRCVLGFAEKLREVETTQVDAAAHGNPLCNVFREDEPCDWLSAEEALRNAPRQANGLFLVTKVVE